MIKKRSFLKHSVNNCIPENSFNLLLLVVRIRGREGFKIRSSYFIELFLFLVNAGYRHKMGLEFQDFALEKFWPIYTLGLFNRYFRILFIPTSSISFLFFLFFLVYW